MLPRKRGLSQDARKVVTILFCDLVGSTALGERLDPESVREVLDRYFAAMANAIERHGGVVEKYIGDAVMAVFGLPRVHEDDALRAVRAAIEMRGALAFLNDEIEFSHGVRLVNRSGINTGEVVVGDAESGQRLATGDAVNVAARFEQAAPPNGILISESTYHLVSDSVELEAVGPLSVKGKSSPLAAFRLLDLTGIPEGISRRLDAPMVGRDRDLEEIQRAFDRAILGRCCERVTILGEAGIGKTRLVREVIRRSEERATVLVGRCPSYGEGITFWPLREIVMQAAGITENDSTEEARAKLRLIQDTETDAVADRLATAIGLDPPDFPLQETFWATRRFLEGLAILHPVVAVFEDVHWAEQTLLDLIAYLTDTCSAPVLLVSSARKDVLAGRVDQISAGATVVALEPLSAGDTDTLIKDALGVLPDEDVRSQVLYSAQGNPLFVEQILAMWVSDGVLERRDNTWCFASPAREVVVPPTVSALLSARLDRLDEEERAVLGAGSVAGDIFYRGAVEFLCGASLGGAVPRNLKSLSRKELLESRESVLRGEDAFAFRHVLIRDSAYHRLLKRTRALLHERCAEWLQKVTRDRADEYEEIVGYHLEQSFLYRADLGRVGEEEITIAHEASARLAACAKRAFSQGVMSSAANLFDRASNLVQDDDRVRSDLLCDLGQVLLEAGELRRAEEVLAEAAEAAKGCRDDVLIARASVGLLLLRFHTDPKAVKDAALAGARHAMAVCEAGEDFVGLARCWRLMADICALEGDVAGTQRAARRVIEFARRTGDRREETRHLTFLSSAALFGRMPVRKGIALSEEILSQVDQDRSAKAIVMMDLAVLEAMDGRFDRARRHVQEGLGIQAELGVRLQLSALGLPRAGMVELTAGDPAAAERHLRTSYQDLVALGERGTLPDVAASLARALFAMGNFEEAAKFVSIASEAAPAEDRMAQIGWRVAAGPVLARQGDVATAEGVVRQAIKLGEKTDDLTIQASALVSLAEVLQAAARFEEAERALTRALSLYQQKGNVALAKRTQSTLDEVHESRERP